MFDNQNDGQAVAEFDLNDPNLRIEVPEGYDPEADLDLTPPPPPADGVNWVRLVLADDTEQKEAVYFSKGKVVANFKGQFVSTGEDGELKLGQFTKNFYPTTQVFQGQTTSRLAALCKLAGKPLPRTTSPLEIIKHVKAVFGALGEAGLIVKAKTQWIKSVKAEDGSYIETKGQAAIAQAAVAAAQFNAASQGLGEDEIAAAVAFAQKNPHVYDDNGTERTVRAEIRDVVGQ